MEGINNLDLINLLRSLRHTFLVMTGRLKQTPPLQKGWGVRTTIVIYSLVVVRISSLMEVLFTLRDVSKLHSASPDCESNCEAK